MTIVTVLQIERALSLSIILLLIFCTIMVWGELMRLVFLPVLCISQWAVPASVRVSSMQITSSQRHGKADLHFFLLRIHHILRTSFLKARKDEGESQFPPPGCTSVMCTLYWHSQGLLSQGTAFQFQYIQVWRKGWNKKPSVLFSWWRWCLPLGKESFHQS